MNDLLETCRRWLDRTPIVLRLVGLIVVPVLILLTLAGAYILNVLEDRFEHRMEEDVEMVARSLQLPVSHALERKRLGSLGKSLTSALRIGRVYGVRLYDQTGKPIASTVGDTRKPAPKKVVELDDKRAKHGEYTELAGRQVYSYFVPLFDSADTVIGFLEVTRRKRDFREFMGSVRWRAAGGLLLVILLASSIVLVGYHSGVGRAVNRLRESMADIAGGDHDHRAPESGPREITRIAESMNAMLDSLQDAEQQIQREQRVNADLKRELVESEKMAAVGRVSAGVSHELGTPLGTISGHLQRIERRTDPGSALDDSVTTMQRETDRMQRIIRQMLDFGRSSRANRSEFTPAQLVDYARENLEQLARTHGGTIDFPDAHSLEDHTETEPSRTLEVIPARIEQALAKLIENALRASPNNRTSLTWEVTADAAHFLVDDDGPGVDPEVRDELFEPFTTTHSNDGGVGLGLAIVDAVAREHGGDVSFEKSPTGGARFRITIPLADSTRSPAQRQTTP